MTQQSSSPPPIPGGTPPPQQQAPQSNTFVIVLLVVGACAFAILAIVGILAAIAIPNFLEAETRAKVSRSKSDMRSMATGVEAYYVDYKTYPRYITQITSPVAYLSRLPQDPFNPGSPIRYQMGKAMDGDSEVQVYVFYSAGPDMMITFNANTFDKRITVDPKDPQMGFQDVMYDATNGTLSDGDVMRFSY